MKKILLLLIIICMYFVSRNIFAIEQEASEPSVITWMYEKGFTKYSTVENFGWDHTISRGEAAKFFTEFALLNNKSMVKSTDECRFNDIGNYDQTLYDYIISACKLGIMKGHNGSFFPNNNISEIEGMTAIVRIIHGMQDESKNPWRRDNFGLAKTMGWVKTNISSSDLSRGSIATRLYKANKTTLESYTQYDEAIGNYYIIQGYQNLCPTEIKSLDTEIDKSTCYNLNDNKDYKSSGSQNKTWKRFEPGNMCIAAYESGNCTKDVGIFSKGTLITQKLRVGSVTQNYITQNYTIQGKNFFVSTVKITHYVGIKANGILSEEIVKVDKSGSFNYEISQAKGNLSMNGGNVYLIEYSSDMYQENEDYIFYKELFILDVKDPNLIKDKPDFSLDKVIFENNKGTIRMKAYVSNVGNVDYIFSSKESIEVSCSMVSRGMGPRVGDIKRNINRDYDTYKLKVGDEPLEFVVNSTIDYESVDRNQVRFTCYIHTPVEEIYTRNNIYQTY